MYQEDAEVRINPTKMLNTPYFCDPQVGIMTSQLNRWLVGGLGGANEVGNKKYESTVKI